MVGANDEFELLAEASITVAFIVGRNVTFDEGSNDTLKAVDGGAVVTLVPEGYDVAFNEGIAVTFSAS